MEIVKDRPFVATFFQYFPKNRYFQLNRCTTFSFNLQHHEMLLFTWTLFGLVLRIFDMANSPRYLRFWSESSIRILSFWTHNCIAAVWLGIPDEIEIRTAMTVLIHSYKSDMAEVEWIREVSGSINFLPNRGSEIDKGKPFKAMLKPFCKFDLFGLED